MFIPLQVDPSELLNINWDAITIPSLLGLLLVGAFFYIKNLQNRVEVLNDKRIDDLKEYSESLREINEETNDQFNKFMISWEIFKSTTNVNK